MHKRRLLTIVSVASLLCGMAIAVLWVRSYRVTDCYYFAPHSSSTSGLSQPWRRDWGVQYSLMLCNGQIRLFRVESPFLDARRGWGQPSPLDNQPAGMPLGFEFHRNPASVRTTSGGYLLSIGRLAIGVPLWFLLLLTLILPLIWWPTGGSRVTSTGERTSGGITHDK